VSAGSAAGHLGALREKGRAGRQAVEHCMQRWLAWRNHLSAPGVPGLNCIPQIYVAIPTLDISENNCMW
jgi:hypothetical protein